MKNGLLVMEQNGTDTSSIYFDPEALEFARLNAQTRKRRADAEAEEANRKQLATMKAQRKACAAKNISFVLADCAVSGAVVWAGMAEMIHPAIFIPVAIACLCAACVRFGAWAVRRAEHGTN